MAEGFKIADAYVDVQAEVEERELVRSARVVGTRAGRETGRKITEHIGDGVKERRGKLATIGGFIAGTMGGGLLRGVSSLGSGVANLMPGVLSNPYVLAAAVAAGAAIAPALMAGISGALIGGAGLGVIGLGALLLKEEPALVKAGTKLKTDFLNIFKSAAKPLLGPLVASLGKFDALVKELSPQFKQMFAAVAPSIGPLTDGIIALIRNAMPGLMDLVKASGPFLTAIAPALGDLGKGISQFASAISTAGPDAAVFFKDLFGWISGTIAWWGLLISWTAKGYGEVRKFFTSIPGWVSSAWSGIKSFFAGVGQWFSDVGAWFAALPGKFTAWLGGIGASISNWLSGVGAWFSALPGRIGSFLASLPGVISTAFKTATDRMLYLVGFAIGSVIAFFRDLPKNAMAAVSSLWDFISGAFTTAKDRAISTVTGLVTGAWTWLQGLPGKAASAVSSLWSRMTGAFSSAKSQAVSSATSLVTGAINVIKGLPGKAASALSTLKSSVLGALKGAANWLYSAGQDLMRGLINGLKSMVSSAISAITSALKSVVKGAKDALGIGSPSKVFRDQVGRWLLPGVGEGVKRTTRAARVLVGNTVKTLVPDARNFPRRPGPGDGPAAGGGQVIHIGTVTLDASRMQTIDDVINLIAGLTTSSRSWSARTATAAGR